MELEMEAVEDMSLAALAERLTVAAEALEQAAARVCDVQAQAARSTRESELQEQLAEAHATIAAMKAAGRKTAPAGTGSLMAKEGPAVDFAGLDAAMNCLSIEQRIAVKAGLLRSGLAG